LDAGLIQARPDLVSGSLTDFEGATVDEMRNTQNRGLQPWLVFDYAPNHTLHPIRPLRVELAFGNNDLSQWDSQDGKNYRVEFDMFLRGWKNFLGCGLSANPHGGIGFLEYRNLVSNYFDYEKRRRDALGANWKNELGRDLIAGNFDSGTWNFGDPGGPKVSAPKRERFMAVDYMDLHILQPDCGIGIHRHRDNQEAFFLLQGKGLMLVGDWAQFENRDRAFELRTMRPGDITICKTGQLHALFNSMDEECLLFMFGGYD
jgi:mannose-6-phosphate isomerase-like protein (cupin superfamily)